MSRWVKSGPLGTWTCQSALEAAFDDVAVAMYLHAYSEVRESGLQSAGRDAFPYTYVCRYVFFLQRADYGAYSSSPKQQEKALVVTWETIAQGGLGPDWDATLTLGESERPSSCRQETH